VPYNISEESVERWRMILDRLVAEPNSEHRIKSNDPTTLSYRLREALASARELSIEPYNALSFRFRVQPGVLVARPKIAITAEIIETRSIAPDKSLVFAEATTVFDVLEIVRKHPELEQLHFPAFAGDATPLVRWSQAKGYTLTDEPVLILTKDS
jgi:hypothetical protein